MRFTETNVKTFPVDPNKADHYEWDEETPGLGVRVQFGGGRTYVLKYRIGAKQRKTTIKRVGQITLAEARRLAKKDFSQVAEQIDPQKLREKRAAAASGHTIPAWIEPFCTSLTEQGRVASWVAFNRFALTTHWQPLHKMTLMEIEREDVADQLTWLNENSGLASSDQCRAVLSKFFNWMISKGKHKGFNPVTGTEKNGGKKRDRLLTPAELKKIWNGVKATDGSLDDYGRIIHVLMLTGQRLSEVADLDREEVLFGKRLISLPGERTKNGLPHDIPMSAPVMELLRDATKDKDNRRHNGGPPLDDDAKDFFFGSGKSQTKGYRGWSKSKAGLDEKIGLKKPWVHHDLRRACSTYMRDECKALPHVVEAVLNHVSGADKGGVAGVYNQAKYNSEKREALDQYAEWIARTVS